MTSSDGEPTADSASDRAPEPEQEPIVAAERAATALSSDRLPRGKLGPRFDRRSPFFTGMAGAAGVVATLAVVLAVRTVASVLILIGVAFFLALGLEPLVRWATARRIPRWAAVTTVFVVGGAALAALVAAAIPPLTEQATQLIVAAPHYFEQLTDPASWIGRLNTRFDLQHRLTQFWGGAGTSVLGEIVVAGQAVFTALADTLIVTVLTIYFLADLPRLRVTLFRFVPRSRRPRAILLGDEIFAKVGAYVLGNVLISVIAGAATFVWLTVFSVPYALLLGVFVAVLDLVPLVGSTIAGIAVAAVALTVSVPICITTVVFFVAFRLGEDYLLVPKIIGRSVQVPALSTLIAVLIGGALLGLVGALVAIPVAAALHLIAQEVLFPRLGRA
ncbi:AI-2E family transporter [Rhodococcus chondri]|uniref:AI-2E family transporter n=1 Tax=Rhodococcus chondri TaxID=3065941 RepID=A0ABU7JYQ0_9NOCA|nr:AI-2E family transporter [Rhodococcus sp. CC-R104]MEE2035134.1 AI-2E family transporter [Rhodococcus sp. CC-R104]